MNMIETFIHPKSCVFSDDIALTVNGLPVEVLRTQAADFANFVYDASQGCVEVVIRRMHDTIDAFKIRPLRLGIEGQAEVKTLRFNLTRADKLSVEIDGLRPLFLWANPPELDKPSPEDPKVRYFKAGQIYELGKFSMESGQTLYIEGGAVVKGRLETSNAQDVTIRGYGIFDGSYYLREEGHWLASITFDHCQNVVVRDITMIRPAGWMLVPGCCDQVDIFNIKQIGEVISSDGIDVVGSRDVHVHDCFLRNNDDCLVVKAFHLGGKNLTDTEFDFARSPERILFERCTLVNAEVGHAMEIGHELTVDHVEDVSFRDIDVLSVHGSGAVFSLHNNDRAHVRKVVFEDIRIEHCWDKLIDFRVSRSKFSSDTIRGSICEVLLKDIYWSRPDINEGYTLSMVSGWDSEHTIEDVRIDNLRINGKAIEHIDELELVTRYAKDVRVI